MQSRLNPYIAFKDSTRQAMAFYQSVFGGEVTLNKFSELYPADDPAEGEKIMHAVLRAENGITFMAADTPKTMEYNPGASISMLLSGDDESELRPYFEKLSAGGTVAMPLEKAPWGDTFGMCVDKFGITWMVSIVETKA
jgi:PhnB protein